MNSLIVPGLILGFSLKLCIGMDNNTVPQSPEKKYSTGGGPNIAYDPSDYHCGIDDSPPVDTNKLWKDEPNCFDYEGNQYWVGYELTSCCNCIKYICEVNRTGNCDAYFWMKSVDPQFCCIQCDATVYPKGTVMKKTQHEDTCRTLEIEKCEAEDSYNVYVSREKIPTECCINETGLQPQGSQYLDPATCTESHCMRTQKGQQRQPTWYTRQLYETCDCCMYKGSMVPPGFSTPLSFFRNATCCEGEIVETIPPPLDYCTIMNMTYLIDTSGSMGGSKIYWEKAALELVDFMILSQVDPASYTLLDYVTTVQIGITTPSSGVFENAIKSLSFAGSRELTFEGLYKALTLSPCHNFIMLFTDEIGDDTTDQTLKEQIISLRDQKKSVIFFMIVASSSNFPTFQTTFGDIGYVFQINVHESQLNTVLEQVTEIMVESDLCKENCTASKVATTPQPIARPPTTWTTILRRRNYGNPPDYFSNMQYSDFVSGFGDPMQEFWIGLRALHSITSSGNWMLYVELDDENESTLQHIAQYGTFKVTKNKTGYKLKVGNFFLNSTADDCMYSNTYFAAPNTDDCSKKFNAGWWFKNSAVSTDCGCSSLMGTLGATDGTGVVWGINQNLTSFPFAEMKITPYTLPQLQTTQYNHITQSFYLP